jgi:hypothetical protein
MIFNKDTAEKTAEFFKINAIKLNQEILLHGLLDEIAYLLR